MKKQLSGKIRQDGHIIIFTSDEYRFTFVCVDDYRGLDGHHSPLFLRPDEAGYVWGVTSERKVIAIYIKEARRICHSMVTDTWNYIIVHGNSYKGIDGKTDKTDMMDSVVLETVESDALSRCFRFDGIEFVNGFVRSVNPCNSLHEDVDLENKIIEYEKQSGKEATRGVLVYKVTNDTQRFNVDFGNSSTIWQYGSVVTQHNDINKGEAVLNDTSNLIIEFTTEQTLKTFYDYFGYVSDMLAFLTFRKNVFFESIRLLAKQFDYGYSSIAECYVKYGKTALLRDIVRVVPVKSLTDDMFRNLVYCLVARTKENIGLPINIIPGDDIDAYTMTTEKIRSICSALETEISASGVKSVRNVELENLVCEVKKVIRAHRKQSDKEHKLPEKTYNNIFSSISHWSDPAADRFIVAWHANEELNLTNGWDINVSDRDIEEFVKARNDITHNGLREITDRTAITGVALSALIYSMTLQRIGMSRDFVKNIMGRRLIQ